MSNQHPTFTADELASEVWKDIPGYEGRYSASSLGRIMGTGRKYGAGTRKIITQTTVMGGYKRVSIYADGVMKNKKVHQLVMLAFIGPRPDGCECNHVNFNRADNRPENLNYLTHFENMKHSAENRPRGEKNGSRLHPETLKRGTDNSSAKLTEQDVLNIRQLLAKGESMRSVAAKFLVGCHAIQKIKDGITWRHV